jgi:hypothetical protein
MTFSPNVCINDTFSLEISLKAIDKFLSPHTVTSLKEYFIKKMKKKFTYLYTSKRVSFIQTK